MFLDHVDVVQQPLAGWPDVVVAAIMAGLALQGAWTVIRQSVGELRRPVFSVAAE